tara:strand:+ start:666 stop:896 length:231 start_codon:yes stop_codon:yes gene_type:complete
LVAGVVKKEVAVTVNTKSSHQLPSGEYTESPILKETHMIKRGVVLVEFVEDPKNIFQNTCRIIFPQFDVPHEQIGQ